MNAATGDNHIVLLLKAYFMYFDMIAAILTGMEAMRNLLSSSQVVVNTSTQAGWPSQVMDSNRKIVNVLGSAPDYQEFWAYCCFDKAPIYAGKRADGVLSTTVFSRYSFSTGSSMTCLCDYEAYSTQRTPAFFGKPMRMLAHIKSYVQRYALQQQANEALQIAMMWPTLLQSRAHISLPRPLHTVDWFAGEMERSSIETTYKALLASSPLVTLASTLASALAFRSQIYDYITLLTSKRATWALSPEAIRSTIAWFSARASAPGAGWDFLFRHQFHTTPSFLYLIGLSSSAVDWHNLLDGQVWSESLFPAHLRLLQPFWVNTSVACLLPWFDVWTPKFEIEGAFLSAHPSTIMRMILLGMLRDEVLEHKESVQRGIYSVLARDGYETIAIRDVAVERVRVAREHGVRVFALFGDEQSNRTMQLTSNTFHPLGHSSTNDGGYARGLLQHLKIQAESADAIGIDISIESTAPRNVDQQAVDAASSRLEKVLKRQEEKARDLQEDGLKKLRTLGSQVYDRSSTQKSPERSRVIYTPSANSASALWCLVFLMRAERGTQESLQSIKRRITQRIGSELRWDCALTQYEMGGLCAILQLDVRKITSDGETLCSSKYEEDLATAIHLSLLNGCWTVQGEEFHLESERNEGRQVFEAYRATSIKNMPGAGGRRVSHVTSQPSSKPVLACPRWNLQTKVVILDQAIRMFDLGLNTASNVQALHKRLFPHAGVPRFLRRRKHLERGRPAAETAQHNEGVHTISSYLLQHIYNSISKQELTHFISRYKEDVQACELTWPHRSPENRQKNNVSVHLMLHMLSIDVEQEALAIWWIFSNQGNASEFVCAVALWVAGAQLCENAWDELFATNLLQCNEDTWLVESTYWHGIWRKSGLTQCSCDECWSQLLYLQALWGRGGVSVQWEKELSNKASVPDDILAFTGSEWSASYATDVIRNAIVEVLSTATNRLFLRTFDDFMDHAYEWLVNGSSAGLPSAFKDTAIRKKLLDDYGVHPRPTKRSVMEKIPRSYIRDQLNSRPQVVAKLHQKLNETGGKARAIYGVTMWHYIFSNWLMAPFEKSINHPSIDINLRNDYFLKLQMRRSQDSKNSAYFNSYDYPDFNSMHTHHHMGIVYEEASRLAESAQCLKTMSEDDAQLIRQGYEWLRQSIFTQVCYLPGSGEFIQSMGGLFSGNRDTTLLNTVLNVAYAKVVDQSCLNMGLNPRVNWRLCHGDDIITQHETYASALSWNYVADRSKLKGQESKVLVERSYHEYLRVMGCPDGKLRGSLARVVATFVNGNWENDYTPGMYGKIRELLSTLGVLKRRSLRPALCQKIWQISLGSMPLHGFRMDGSGTIQKGLDLLQGLSIIPTTSADLSVAISYKLVPSPHEDHIFSETELRKSQEIERLYSGLADEVTRPYLRRLMSALPMDLRNNLGTERRLKLVLQKSTYGSELPKRYQVETRQSSQVIRLAALLQEASTKRGRFVRRVHLDEATKIVGEHRILSSTRRRIKAFHSLLSVIDDLGGYTKPSLLAYLCQIPEANIALALSVDDMLKERWQRADRPAAPEAASLEDDVEIFLACDKSLADDEEVVIFCDDGQQGFTDVRDVLLY